MLMFSETVDLRMTELYWNLFCRWTT